MLPRQRAARALQLILGFGISAVAIWWAFHKRSLSEIWSSIHHARLAPMLLGVVIATLAFPLRVPRWRLLLRREDSAPVDAMALWHAIAIGFAANNVLPFRAGEVLRVAAANRIGGVSVGAGVSSVAVERVLDALTVLALLGIGLLAAHLPPEAQHSIGRQAAAIGALCIAALVFATLAAWRRDTALRLFERVLGSGPIAVRIVSFVDHVLQGLGAMRDLRRAAPIVLWSLAIWLCTASGFYVAFAAFGFGVPFSGALILQGAIMIGIAAPQAPGYFGVFEGITVTTLSLYGVDSGAAFAYALMYHVTTFVPITLLGAMSAVRKGIRLRAPDPAP